MADSESTWRVFSWLWDQKDEIATRLAALYAWFRGAKRDGRPAGDRGILILGPGGTGKTTLARLLSGEFDGLSDSPWEFRESIDVESCSYKDDPRVGLTVLPGQPFRRPSSWLHAMQELSAGQYRGVILTAAYGFHNFGVRSYKDHHLYKGDKAAFLQAYFADRRQEEVTIIGDLVKYLQLSPKPVWLLVVVTKEDLWASRRKEVEGYYRADPYSGPIRSAEARLGGASFKYEIVLGSLLICNLRSPADEMLVANEPGYDHRRQVESVRHLMEVVSVLKQWEEQR